MSELAAASVDDTAYFAALGKLLEQCAIQPNPLMHAHIGLAVLQVP